MAQKYQNYSDLDAAVGSAVKREKNKQDSAIDPKARWKMELSAARRKKSLAIALGLIPVVLGSIAYGAHKMGFYMGQPAPLSAALSNPNSAPRLNLDNLRLEAFPAELQKLPNLEELSLASNSISAIPPDFEGLKKLKTLDVSYNELTALPDKVDLLGDLEELRLRANKLTGLPLSLAKLRQLRLLDLSDNPIQVLPENIGELAALEVLRLKNTKLSKLPAGLAKLSRLKELDLTNTPIAALPDLKNFPNLKTLILRGTKVSPELANSYRQKFTKVMVLR